MAAKAGHLYTSLPQDSEDRQRPQRQRRRGRLQRLLCDLLHVESAFVIGVIVTLVIIICTVFVLSMSGSDLAETAAVDSPRVDNTNSIMWKEADLSKLELPIVVDNDDVISSVDVKIETIMIKNISVRYRHANRPNGIATVSNQILFLLHGAAFTSKTWVDQVPTIQTFASLGYRVIAIDLPGYGETPGGLQEDQKGVFLAEVLTSLCGSIKPVLVSPSMSGSFSLQLLSEKTDAVSGFIPVAPVGTGGFPESFYTNLNLPTMIVLGDRDHGLGQESLKNLRKIPNSTQPQILENAGHPAYLDQPRKWHQLVYNFLKLLQD